MDCTCYVQHLKVEDQRGLHYGAHNATCPKYRRSGDPLDRQQDEEFRARTEPDYLEPEVAEEINQSWELLTGQLRTVLEAENEGRKAE